MPGDDLAILGVGLASPLGGATHAAAAARAGIQRLQALPGFEVHDPEADEMVPLSGFSATTLTHGFEGRARLMQLATAALTDLHAATPALMTVRRLGLVLVLSGHGLERVSAQRQEAEGNDGELAEVEAGDADRRADLADFTSTLAARLSWLKPTKTALLFGEHTSLAVAMAQAQTWLSDGSCDGCLVGAVDSTVDPGRLPVLLAGDLLATPGNPHAFTAGEAGAFLLVTNTTSTARPLAHLGPLSAAKEDQPGAATALAQVITDVLATSGVTQGTWFLDHTGEVWRFATHGHALVMVTSAHARVGDLRTRLVAEQFGELGPATGLVSCILACRGFAREHAHGSQALISLSDHDGERVAVMIRAAEG